MPSKLKNHNDSNKDGDKPENKENPKSPFYKRYGITIALIFVILFFGLYVFINESTSKEEKKTTASKLTTEEEVVIGCTENRNTIGDGLCDVATNSEECGFDGGDCCLEEKSTALCQSSCDCDMKLDVENLRSSFAETNVHVVEESSQFYEAEQEVTYFVEDVVSLMVCSQLCLNEKRRLQVNSWNYNLISRNCSCTWTKTDHCIDDNRDGLIKVQDPDQVEPSAIVQMFLQVAKILPCDCMENDVIVKHPTGDKKTVKSPWHCKFGCGLDNDCKFFSFDLLVPESEENCLFSNAGGIESKDGFVTGSKSCGEIGTSAAVSTTTTTLTATSKTSKDVIPITPVTTTTTSTTTEPIVHCTAELMGDGYCHESQNVAQCAFDGYDCCSFQNGQFDCISQVTTEPATENPPNCLEDYLTDSFCDGQNNVAACSYDGGACCQSTGFECMFCEAEECICHIDGINYCDGGVTVIVDIITTTTTSERTFDPSCNAEYIGDGYCDGDNNNEMCFYDDNDCCIEHEHFCEGCQGQTCVCHSDGINYCGGSNSPCAEGYIGDGWCDGSNNNELCSYDGDDCCEYSSLDQSCNYCEQDACLCHKDGLKYCEGEEEDDGCGPTNLVATHEYQDLTSPNYGSGYPQNSFCEWFISVTETSAIYMQFSDLDVPCASVTIYQSRPDGMYEFIWWSHDSTLIITTSIGRSAKIQFSSSCFDQSQVGKGFFLYFVEVTTEGGTPPPTLDLVQYEQWTEIAGNKEIWISSNLMDIHNALDLCNSLDSRLLEPRVEDIFNSALTKAAFLSVARVWIGVLDTQEENRFMFASTFEDVTFTSWNPGEPNDYDGVEDYVEVHVGPGGWNDLPDWVELTAICERDSTN